MKQSTSPKKGVRSVGNITNQSAESSAIYFAAGCAVVAFVISLFYFQGNVPLFGRDSIGTISLILATIASLVGYFYAANQSRDSTGIESIAQKVRFYLTTFALAFVHAAIVFLLTTIGFYIVQDAFIGLTLDQYASSFITAAVVAGMSYATYLLGLSINTLRISTALAVFLVSGALISMITSTNPYWWQMHLSSLGAGDSVSSYTFEVTLAIGGLVIISVADFVANDFARLRSVRKEYMSVKVNGIRVILSIIGVMLALVGLFAYDTNPLIHNVSASGMVIMFIILIAALPFFVPTFSRAFFIFSYSLMAFIVLCEILYNSVGYLNLTGFEIISFTVVFTWLIVFIRQIAAKLADQAPIKGVY